MPDYQTILAERRGAVLVLTLNRPDRLNAASLELADELNEALGRVDGARAGGGPSGPRRSGGSTGGGRGCSPGRAAPSVRGRTCRRAASAAARSARRATGR